MKNQNGKRVNYNNISLARATYYYLWHMSRLYRYLGRVNEIVPATKELATKTAKKFKIYYF